MLKKVLRGLKWRAGGLTITRLASLVSIPILARILTPEDYGIQAVAVLALDLFLLLSFGGIRNAIVQANAFNPGKLFVAVTLTTTTGLLSLVILIFAHAVILNILDVPGVGAAILAISLDVPLAGVIAINQSVLNRDLRMKEIALAEMFASLFGGIGVTLALATQGFGYWSLLYGFLANDLVLAVLLARGARPKIRFSCAKADWSHFWPFIFGQSIGALANYTARHGVKFVVIRYLGVEALGLFNRSQRIAGIFVEPLSAFNSSIALPMFSRLQNEEEKQRESFELSISTFFVIMFPFSLFLFSISYEFIYIMLGENWLSAVPVFQILCFVVYFHPGQKLSSSMIRARGRPIRLGLVGWIFAGAATGGSFLVVDLGLVAVACAFLAAIIVYYLILFTIACRLIDLSFSKALSCHLPGVRLAAMLIVPLAVLELALPGDLSVVVSLACKSAVAFLVLVIAGLGIPRFIMGRQLSAIALRILPADKYRGVDFLIARIGS